MATAGVASLLLLLLLQLAAEAASNGTAIHFVNQCEGEIVWYDGRRSRALAAGAVYSTQLAVGRNAAYRAGVTNDATLAEFAVDAGNTWFDISIIPTGPLGGPGSCSSLDECKAVTGGHGFNVAMRIVPSRAARPTCRTLSCLHDGCDDAYHFPDQADRTHNCAAGVSFEVLFCPSDASSSSSSSSLAAEDSRSIASEASQASSDASDATSEVEAEAKAPASTRSGGTSSSTGGEQRTGNYSDAAAVESSSSAVIVAIVLGGSAVAVVLGAVALRHWRVLALRWEAAHWHKPRDSSPTLSFVELEATP